MNKAELKAHKAIMKENEQIQKRAEERQLKIREMELRERSVELAIRAGSYGRSAVAQLVAKTDKRTSTLTADAKRIYNFIKTGR